MTAWSWLDFQNHIRDRPMMILITKSKNVLIMRIVLSYQHISQKWASELNTFNLNYLLPYINNH